MNRPDGSSPVPGKRTWPGILRRILYVTLPVVILAMIFNRIDLPELKANIARTNPWLVALGIGYYPLAILVGATRWRMVVMRLAPRRVSGCLESLSTAAEGTGCSAGRFLMTPPLAASLPIRLKRSFLRAERLSNEVRRIRLHPRSATVRFRGGVPCAPVQALRRDCLRLLPSPLQAYARLQRHQETKTNR